MKYYVIKKDPTNRINSKIILEIASSIEKIIGQFDNFDDLFCIEEDKMEIRKLPDGILPWYSWQIWDEQPLEDLLSKALSEKHDNYIRKMWSKVLW